jgi:Zn-finger nucleic acid-binding protein
MDLTCPKCHAPMRSYERNGVTVDQCGECRGLFLDRGELERLVDAENAWHGAGGHQSTAPAAPAYQQPQPRSHHQPQSYQSQGYQQHAPGRPHKKRKSFLEELFD